MEFRIRGAATAISYIINILLKGRQRHRNMSNDLQPPDDSGAAGTERFNTVVPDLGSGAGWDRTDLSALFKLYPDGDGALLSPHAHLNANGALFGGQLV